MAPPEGMKEWWVKKTTDAAVKNGRKLETAQARADREWENVIEDEDDDEYKQALKEFTAASKKKAAGKRKASADEPAGKAKGKGKGKAPADGEAKPAKKAKASGEERKIPKLAKSVPLPAKVHYDADKCRFVFEEKGSEQGTLQMPASFFKVLMGPALDEYMKAKGLSGKVTKKGAAKKKGRLNGYQLFIKEFKKTTAGKKAMEEVEGSLKEGENRTKISQMFIGKAAEHWKAMDVDEKGAYNKRVEVHNKYIPGYLQFLNDNGDNKETKAKWISFSEEQMKKIHAEALKKQGGEGGAAAADVKAEEDKTEWFM